MKSNSRSRNLITCFGLAFGVLFVGCFRGSNDFVEPPPPDVTVATPVQQDMTQFIEDIGELEATSEADVRSRVRGFIEELLFEPGQVVNEGDPLYKIESDEYAAAQMSAEAQVESAVASIAVAEATKATNAAEVKRAENDLARSKTLLESNAGSQSEYDQSLAARDAAIAQSKGVDASIELANAELSAAKATLAQAKLDLDYTTVRAPISGRITRTMIYRGNLADNGSALATIVDRESIYVYFTINERSLLELMKMRPEERDSGPMDWSKIPVYLQRDEQDSQWRQGTLQYVDQTGIDQATGTLSLRALFENPNDDLLPGMFVTVRLPISRAENALLVPQQSITRSQQGNFVMVVGNDNKVERRPIKLGQTLDNWVLVTNGLEKDEKIIVEGLQRARPGGAVNPTLITLSTEDSPILQAAIELTNESEVKASKPQSPKSKLDYPATSKTKSAMDPSEPITNPEESKSDSPQEAEPAS